MNKLDKQYQQLLQDIIDYGVEKKDRTGTGTKSIFGYTIRHNMSEGFPLLTTKKMAWKTMVTELLWFLRGDTNIKFLVENGCHIWDGDAYKNYCKTYPDVEKTFQYEGSNIEVRKMSQEEFINKIKTDDEFAKKWGELGPIYGKQWRSWEKWYIDENKRYLTFTKKIDQIQNLINDLKTNPDSRRLMVNAWNVGELDQMVLPPCHYGFQVYTRELSNKERIILMNKKLGVTDTLPQYYNTDGEMDKNNIPTRAISLMWNQRSVDTFLGLPFNIASYGLLLEIIAKIVNMVPDELIGNLGDVHLYNNHIEQAKEQIGRKYSHEERHELLKKAMGDFYQTAVDEQVPFGGGLSEYYDSYKIPHHSREPYKLPELIFGKTDEFWKSTSEDISLFGHLDPVDFTVQDYQSHPTIKAPLSN
jgi:thymidylate synthase